MKPKLLFSALLILSFILSLLIVTGLSGCADTPLRFAPSESQKHVALKTHLNAVAVNATGAQPKTDATVQLVDGTAVSLAYTGMPSDPDITDYAATAAQAQSDATLRPTADDVFENVEGGLGFLSEVLIALGGGGLAVGGKKLVDLIGTAKDKSKALQEIIQGNEWLTQLLKQTGDTSALAAFKAYQEKVQSDSTAQLVAAERVAIKQPSTPTVQAATSTTIAN